MCLNRGSPLLGSQSQGGVEGTEAWTAFKREKDLSIARGARGRHNKIKDAPLCRLTRCTGYSKEDLIRSL
jgi:hypothetical protein